MNSFIHWHLNFLLRNFIFIPNFQWRFIWQCVNSIYDSAHLFSAELLAKFQVTAETLMLIQCMIIIDIVHSVYKIYYKTVIIIILSGNWAIKWMMMLSSIQFCENAARIREILSFVQNADVRFNRHYSFDVEKFASSSKILVIFDTFGEMSFGILVLSPLVKLSEV